MFSANFTAGVEGRTYKPARLPLLSSTKKLAPVRAAGEGSKFVRAPDERFTYQDATNLTPLERQIAINVFLEQILQGVNAALGELLQSRNIETIAYAQETYERTVETLRRMEALNQQDTMTN